MPRGVKEDGVSWQFIALPAQVSSEYVWYWRRENQKGRPDKQSARTFSFYYECLEDARQHGYMGLPPQLQSVFGVRQTVQDGNKPPKPREERNKARDKVKAAGAEKDV